MKKIKLLSLLLLFSSSLFFTSCGNGEKEENPLADSLMNENNAKAGKINSQEAAIQEFVNAFNEIQTNLNEIKEKEKIVINNSKSGDVKNKEDDIKNDIQAIYDLMNKNKTRIASLGKKLKNANKKIEGLEQMIATLEAQLNEKDAQINTLKGQVEQLNIELSNLNLNYQEVEEEVEVKTVKLNTAYYAIGTLKELKEKGVVTKEGGFIGLGKTAQLKSDFNKDYFTKVDITQNSTIPLGTKKAKLLTTHPSASYKLVGNEKKVEKLEILNAEDFWSASKYLVIVIE